MEIKKSAKVDLDGRRGKDFFLGVVLVLALLSFLATRKLKEVPGPLQNLAEMAIEKLQSFLESYLCFC